MMGRIEHCDCYGGILSLHAADFSVDNVECLVPPDRLVPGDTAVLRIPCTMRIEVHTHQWCQDALVGVDERLQRQRMGAPDGPAPRCERPAACADGPTKRVRPVPIDLGSTERL